MPSFVSGQAGRLLIGFVTNSTLVFLFLGVWLLVMSQGFDVGKCFPANNAAVTSPFSRMNISVSIQLIRRWKTQGTKFTIIGFLAGMLALVYHQITFDLSPIATIFTHIGLTIQVITSFVFTQTFGIFKLAIAFRYRADIFSRPFCVLWK